MSETIRDAGSKQANETPVIFERVVIEAFRGFNARVDIDLRASVVLVHGPNGLGKTSLFDALQWVLVGDLPRLRTARLKPSDEYIVNAYRQGENASVTAHVRLGGSRVVLHRTGNRSGSVLTWVADGGPELRGPSAEVALASAFSAAEGMSLQDSLTACGLLQQDAARLVLQASARDRFATFSSLLGLGDLADFEIWCQTRDKAAAGELKSAEDALARAEQQLAADAARLAQIREAARTRPLISEVEQRLQSVARELGFSVEAATDREGAVRIAAAAANAARESAQIASEVRRLISENEDAAAIVFDNLAQGSSVPEPPLTALLEALESQVADAVAERTAATAAEQRAQEDLLRLQEAQASLARMASAVLPHVEGPACPVCGQAVNEDELRAHLTTLEGALPSAEARAAVEMAHAARQEADLRLGQLAGRRDTIRQQIERRERWAGELEQVESRLRGLVRSDSAIGFPSRPPAALEAEAWLRTVTDGATVIAALARELTTAWDSNASPEEARALKSQDDASQRIEAARESRARLAQARNLAATLLRAAKDARVDVVRQEFNRLSPLAQDVYSRLDPHPTFQHIDLIPEVFRAAGTASAHVRDPVLGISADPMIVFSSAQANIAAISYVVALNWAAASAAPVLMLDDPLQAMDDVNVLGFADLCRHLRPSRQLILSTHERRFAQLLERKLAPRRPSDRTLTIEFVGWDRSGPLVKVADVPDQVDAEGTLLTFSDGHRGSPGMA